MSADALPAKSPSSTLNGHPTTMLRLVPAIFFSSVGAVLFSLSIFRLLSFFIMPSMFFALLLVGFPIGAAWAARQREADVPRFRRMLTILQLVMVVSIFATLYGKHVDYMRANMLFGVDPVQLLIQVLVFALFYLPFFAAYGAAEYVGYLTGTNAFGQRMRPVYGLFLFGGAAAFGIAEVLQRPLGVPKLLVLAVAMISVSQLLLAGKTRQRRILEVVVVLVLGLALSVPGLDGAFMRIFKLPPNTPGTVAHRMANTPGFNVAFAEWGKFGYIEIIEKRVPQQDLNWYAGFYNDVGMWNTHARTPRGEENLQVDQLLPRDKIPFLFIPEENGRVALIGSGGGREILYSRLAGADRILAIEIEPAVVRGIKGPLREGFAGAYTRPPVESYVGEARGYFERHDEKFDLIMLMSVGGYPQLMLEPGNMIRTNRAFELFTQRLTDNGMLAISYDAHLDQEAVLLRQYYHTLRELGMESYGFSRKPGGFILLAFKETASEEQKAQWETAMQALTQPRPGPQPGSMLPAARRMSPGEMAMADFQPITDDRPFLAGNISNILSEDGIKSMFKVLAVLIVVAGLVLGILVSNPQQKISRGVSSTSLMCMGVLIGVNFMLMEHLCVLQMFRHLYVYYDSMIVSIIGFLMLTGLGSLLLAKRWIPHVVVVTLVIFAIWMWAAGEWGLAETMLLLVPGVLVTGAFFPIIFEEIPEGRLQLFGMDAVGSAIGAILAFFIPMLYGFKIFSLMAVGMFVVTSLSMIVFLSALRRGPTVAASPPSVADRSTEQAN